MNLVLLCKVKLYIIIYITIIQLQLIKIKHCFAVDYLQYNFLFNNDMVAYTMIDRNQLSYTERQVAQFSFQIDAENKFKKKKEHLTNICFTVIRFIAQIPSLYQNN